MKPITVALLGAAGLLLFFGYKKGAFGGTNNQPNKNGVGPNGAGGAGNPSKDPTGGQIAVDAIGLAGQLAGLFGGSKGTGTSSGINTGAQSGGGSSLTGNTSGETSSSGDATGGYYGPETQDGSGGGDTVDTESDG